MPRLNVGADPKKLANPTMAVCESCVTADRVTVSFPIIHSRAEWRGDTNLDCVFFWQGPSHQTLSTWQEDMAWMCRLWDPRRKCLYRQQWGYEEGMDNMWAPLVV